MPRLRAAKTTFKRNPLNLILFLVVFILSKIGQIPEIILKFILKNFKNLNIKTFKIHFKFKIWILKFTRQNKLALILIISSLTIFTYTFFTIQLGQILPSPNQLKNPTPVTTEIYDRNGELLYRLYNGRNRSLVKLEELPPELIQATIAIEDKNFYSHFGVDPLAILRALRHNLETGELQGASTITQQLVKNSLLTPEKTYQRKIKEITLAFWAETLFSKDEILQMYFNETPYGGPAWGIETAALMYFGKNAKDLNLAQSAYLAGLPASPTQFSPFGTSPELAKLRQKQVLDRMVEVGFMNQSKADEAFSAPLDIKPPRDEIKAPHFVMYVRDYLSKKYGERVVSQGGLKITTTLDLGLQNQVQEIVKDEVDKLKNLSVSNGAAMVMNSQGQILAMVGSTDYFEPKFGNVNVTLANRQPGSSIKVITYTTAFKQGFNPATIILDTPVKFPDGYSPVNYDGRFHGPVTIRTALGSSYNIPAVKTLSSVGLDNFLETAKDLGITTLTDPKNYGLSLTLGGGEVKMIEMMALYNTFSQNGAYHQPNPILKITDSSSNLLEEYTNSSKQVVQKEIAYLINNILIDNNARASAFGTNSLLNIPNHQVAVKTGTTDQKRDNWTFGYTPEFTVGVWVGNNDNTPMNPTLTSGITGAAPIWNKIMKGILFKQEPVAFERPSGVIDVNINGRRDLSVAGILPKSLVRINRDRDRTTFFDAYSAYSTTSATANQPGSTN